MNTITDYVYWHGALIDFCYTVNDLITFKPTKIIPWEVCPAIFDAQMDTLKLFKSLMEQNKEKQLLEDETILQSLEEIKKSGNKKVLLDLNTGLPIYSYDLAKVESDLFVSDLDFNFTGKDTVVIVNEKEDRLLFIIEQDLKILTYLYLSYSGLQESANTTKETAIAYPVYLLLKEIESIVPEKKASPSFTGRLENFCLGSSLKARSRNVKEITRTKELRKLFETGGSFLSDGEEDGSKVPIFLKDLIIGITTERYNYLMRNWHSSYRLINDVPELKKKIKHYQVTRERFIFEIDKKDSDDVKKVLERKFPYDLLVKEGSSYVLISY